MITIDQAFQSKIGFGGASLSGSGGGYGFGEIDINKGIELVEIAHDLCIYLIDTAPIYGFGESERLIGKAVKNKRDKFFITSKSGITWNDRKRVDLTNDPKIAREMAEQSLRDLDTDYLDMYMVHWPDERIDIRRPLEVLAKLKEEGKVRYIGLCNTNSEDLNKAKEVCKVDVVQAQLNILETEYLSMMEELKKAQIKFQSWGTLDKGILTKSVTKERELAKKYDQYDCRKNAPWWKQSDIVKKIERLDDVWPILEKKNIDPLAWAMGFNLNIAEIDQVLIGFKNKEQLEKAVSLMNHLPKSEEIEEVNRFIK